MEELKIKMIEDKSSKLFGDLNMEKGFEIETIKKIEIKIEKLKFPKTILMQLQNQLFKKKNNISITF